MTKVFHELSEIMGSNYVKAPSRSSAVLSNANNSKHCFSWSILALLHPCEISYPKRESKYMKFSKELHIEELVFQTDIYVVMYITFRN